MLNHSLLRVRIAAQKTLHVAVNLVKVGLVEKSTRMVVDVLGQLLCADATHAYFQKYSKNLLVVHKVDSLCEGNLVVFSALQLTLFEEPAQTQQCFLFSRKDHYQTILRKDHNRPGEGQF